MRISIQTKLGSLEHLQVLERETPTPKAHELLVRVQATTVTAGDTKMVKFPFVLFVPFQIMVGLPASNRTHGHEFAGTVEAVGAAVTRFKVGDELFGTPKGARSGTHTEYLCVKENGVLVHKPAQLSFEAAAAVPMGGMTALQILQRASIKTGQAVLIYGASGSVGTYAVQLAKAWGATVTAVCSTANLELVKGLGADVVIDYTQEDFTQSAQRYDVILDAVGKLKRKQTQHLLKDGGMYLNTWVFTSEKTESLLELKALLEAGALKPVLDRTYPLEQIPEAMRYVMTGRKKGNVIILP